MVKVHSKEKEMRKVFEIFFFSSERKSFSSLAEHKDELGCHKLCLFSLVERCGLVTTVMKEKEKDDDTETRLRSRLTSCLLIWSSSVLMRVSSSFTV